MRLVKHQAWLCAGLIALASPSGVFASSIQFATTGQFSDISATAGTRYRARTNDESGKTVLAWQGSNSNFSRIKFVGYSLPGQGNLDFSTDGSPFALGKLVFQNGGACGLPGINSADLTLDFLLGDTDTPSAQFDFGLNLSEQSKLSHKRGKHRQGDLLTLSSSNNSFEFTTDTGKYQLDVLGWSKDGGVSFVDSLFVANHSISRIKLYATLQAVTGNIPPASSQTVVPVPAAAWLLGSGVLALIGAARRR